MGDSAFRNEDMQARKVVTLSPLVKGFAGGLECRNETAARGVCPKHTSLGTDILSKIS